MFLSLNYDDDENWMHHRRCLDGCNYIIDTKFIDLAFFSVLDHQIPGRPCFEIIVAEYYPESFFRGYDMQKLMM
jgi:hypothetical protein